MRKLTENEKERLDSLLGGHVKKDRIVPLSSEEAARMLDEAAGIMSRAKQILKRFAARYADSDHAKAAVKETNLTIQEIDDWMLRR